MASKRIICLLMCLALMAGIILSACSSTEPASAAPSEEPAAAPEPTPEPEEPSVLVISEVMAKNHMTLRDAQGNYPDWVELCNTGIEPVSLQGWHLSDGEDRPGWELPAEELGPGEYRVFFASSEGGSDCADFGISAGETVCLFRPSGTLADSLFCESDEADVSAVRGADGTSETTAWVTPGFSNDRPGYEAWMQTRGCFAPLQIGEVCAANNSYRPAGAADCADWIELVNVSEQTVSLSDYCLSDSYKDLLRCPLPAGSLRPGERALLFCSDDPADAGKRGLWIGLSLNPAGDGLYLSKTDGTIVDSVYLHDVPVNGSMGRRAGGNGFYYFTETTPGAANTTPGYRFLSGPVTTAEPDGAYDGVEAVKVTLQAEGEIHYTLDGSVPTIYSACYTEPLQLTATTIVRALSVEDGAAPGPVATFCYFINENHTLPVLSLVTDNAAAFKLMYSKADKSQELAGVVAFYEESGSFSLPCGIEMKGFTSLKGPKKSLGVTFKSRYGAEGLCYDVFGNGIEEYASLSIRAGQDYPTTVFRNELMQDLCLAAGNRAMAQESRYCILYINGEYYGIYCLKEDYSAQYYASHQGVSAESAAVLTSPIRQSSELYEDVFSYVLTHDMNTPETYQHAAALFDMEGFIDWVLLEGYSGNTDVNGNIRYLHSTEGDGKWRIAFYDLDWTFRDSQHCFSNLFTPGKTMQVRSFLEALVRCDTFRDRLLTRYAELTETILSDENVAAAIDQYVTVLEPEMQRERARWGKESTYKSWVQNVEALREYILSGYADRTVQSLCNYLLLSTAEREQYFGE